MNARSFPFSLSISASLFCVLLLHGSLQAQPGSSAAPFSQDSAYAFLVVLADEIGPRPMGSPNERAAMEFALRKFREFGLHESFLLPMRETVAYELGGNVNTNSGIAVGVLHGTSSRTIVIGAHIDSASPDIPGANDDGSGSAVVIELARILAQRNNESTIVFALFGGEEQGLRGSRHFVKHFNRMDNVLLMLQVDMANGSDWILPLIDIATHSSPEWLVRASYEELERFGHGGMRFPTHFYSLIKSMPTGGIGSDHEPFLERNIPAIDFTTDVTDPIHTPQDNLANFKPAGLKRSGDLVYGLITRYDGGVPEETGGHYYLLQFGSLLLFIPIPILSFLIVISLGVALIALLQLRKRRVLEDPKARIPGLKLFLLMLIIQTFVWLSENLVGLIKGVRFAWVAEPHGYFLLGFVAGIAGIWVSMQLAPSLHMSRSAYRYALRSLIFLAVFVLLSVIASVKLALYPALGLLLVSLAIIARQPTLRLLFWLLSPYFMFRLVFSEGFLLLARSLMNVPGEGVAGLVTHLFYVLFFSVWSFPFLLAFAALRADSGWDFGWLNEFRKPIGGIITGGVAVVLVFYLSTLPSYSEEWKQTITVRQNLDLDSRLSTVDVVSSEFLSGTRIQTRGIDTLITDRSHRVRLPGAELSDGHSWLDVERTVETVRDSNTTFSILLKIRLVQRPYTLAVTYRGGKDTPQDVSTPFAWSPGPSSISLRWYSFPDSVLTVPIQLTVLGTDSV
ncbi:MAG: M28 family peptidase, partial [Ignavibacteriales bacterium]|nr:M28 family peptidase [Ignavibacteriales bacterium]